jgi:protein O-mannosyl-transferase
VAGALSLLVVAAYWPALRGEFVWDDLLLIGKNRLVTGETTLRTIWFREDFPLATIAFWAQWQAWGNQPLGYHIVNLLLHAINVLMVWRVLLRLDIRGAALAAALFALHPVCVASVAWVSELKNTLSLAFCLVSLWAYLRFENSSTHLSGIHPDPGPVPHRLWFVLSLAAFVLALLTKTSTAMLPVLLLAGAWWQRGRLARKDVWRSLPYFALALGFGLMSVWFQHQAIAGETVQAPGFLVRLAGAGMALWFYLGKALLPLNLNIHYPRWEIDPRVIAFYLPGVLWCIALALCWWFRRGWGRAPLFALGCFTVTLFPVLGFFDMSFLSISRVSDHFQYLPLIAILALVAAGISSMLPVKAVRFIAPALVLLLAGLTFQRSRVFSTDERLWVDTLAKNPTSWNAHNNLACIRAEQHQMDEAIGHFETSLKIHPRNAKAHLNLGRALAMRRQFADADAHFEAALRIKPNDAETRATYGSSLADRGRRDEALAHLREAIRLQPDPVTRLQLAGVLNASGKIREAAEQCREVLKVKPDSIEASSNLAWFLATAAEDSLRDGREAVRLAEQACRLNGYKEAKMVSVLAVAYAEAGQFTNAVATAEKAVALAIDAGDEYIAGVNERFKKLFAAGKPYREPAR